MQTLTREFLLSRGSCCGSGCRNCPYYPKAEEGATDIFKKPDSVECPGKYVCSLPTMQKGNCLCYEYQNLKT